MPSESQSAWQLHAGLVSQEGQYAGGVLHGQYVGWNTQCNLNPLQIYV